MRLLRVAPVSQAVLELGPDLTPVAAERGWWQLPESARVEVIALLARLIARGVLAEDPPSGDRAAVGPAGDPGRSGAGERGE